MRARRVPIGLARRDRVRGRAAGRWLLAAVTGPGLMAAGRADRKTQLPLGPFLIAATLGAALAVGSPG
jgi:hypothetical protein